VGRKGSWVGLLGCSRLGWGGLVFFFFPFSFFQIQIFSKPNKLQTILEFKPRFESNNQK
jgi:hypothetical protein